MSDVKLEDLSPAPFFARFLESQFDRPLTAEEMKAVRGGSSALEQDLVIKRDPSASWPDWTTWSAEWPGVTGVIGVTGVPCLPGVSAPASPVTMAYPSDQVGVGVYPI